MYSLEGLELFAHYLATCIFAFSGTRIALFSGDSWQVSLLAGVLTAVGGGTIRDILNRRNPFWFQEPGYLIISIVLSIIALLPVLQK
jgi:uncharacterized membrane protein YeiH